MFRTAAICWFSLVLATEGAGVPYSWREVTDYNGQTTIYYYEGIPYAKADPFEEPTLLSSRSFGSYGAQDAEAACYQPDDPLKKQLLLTKMNNTVLYLNVYSPVNRKAGGNINTQLPVVVYFHPGQFRWGSKDLVGPRLLITSSFNSIVLVTVNYRLGAYGFLYTGETYHKGNLGLLDQREALRWVRDEIREFGGDPNSVTVMGHGAGAVSVGLHLLNTESSGLFTRAVMLGGTPLAPWAIDERPGEKARQLARRLGCSTNPSKLIYCIKGKDPKTVIDAQEESSKIMFGPVVDGAFLLDHPSRLISQQSLAAKPILLGSPAKGGSLYYYEYKTRSKDGADFSKGVDETLRMLLQPLLNNTENVDSVVRAVKFQYGIRGKVFTSGTDSVEERTIEALTDFLYRAGEDAFLQSQAEKNSPVFRYVFNYTGNTLPSFADNLLSKRFDSMEVTHLADLYSFFDENYKKGGTNDPNDMKVQNIIVMMTNILKSFSTAQLSTTSTLANQLPSGMTTFLGDSPILNRNSERDWRREKMDFWNVLVPELSKVVFPRYPDPELDRFRSATWGLLSCFLLAILALVVLAGLVVMYRRKARRSGASRDHAQMKDMGSAKL